MEISCTENFCPPVFSSSMSLILTLPDFPPPPPIPSFMGQLLQKENLTGSCELCSKWGNESLTQAGNNFTFVLAIVAIISALAGAGIMAAILRMRKRRSSHPDSTRHLERKCNEQSLPLPPSRSSNSTPLSNTYCEGPYPDNKEFNIYAELHNSNCSTTSGTLDLWRRPPIPTPVENCYLELRDLPGGIPIGVGVATPLFLHPHSPQYSLTPSNTTTASYYTDLELKAQNKDII